MKKATASRLAVGLMLSVALPGLSAASDPGEQLMLARASYWRAQQRPDLAAEVLNKLLSANPGQPDALYQQGVLALEQGDRGGAQRYFDRLHQLAPADARAKELTALLAQPAAATVAPAPMAVTTAPASAPVTAVSNVTPVQMPVTRMLPTASASPVATPAAAQKRPELTVASADSDDLTPAKPASASPPAPAGAPASAPTAAVSHLAAATSEAAYPLNQQVAALPPVTISDGNTTIPSTTLAVASAGSNDLGNTAKSVQVAQVELEPPPPIGGYQATLALKPYSPSDTLETYIDRDLARLEAEAAPTLIAGLGFRTHSGTEGTVGLNEFGGTAQFSFSPFDTGSATIAVLPVYLDAGTPANINLQRFGANPVLAAAGLPLASAGDQNASGVGLLGSYTYGDFSGQLGTTPLGFPVTNIVGNVAYTPKFLDGNLAVRFEAVRQPVTDTVLSYAGTHANLATANAVTAGAFGGYGRTWGGVVKTGPHVLAFYDDQNIGIYGGGGFSWYTGENVAQNSSIDALLGAYFRPFKTDWWTLRVGVSGYYIGYEKNLNGFTYGQGGYFSPQNFEGLGFPIEWTGHTGPWSFLAATTLGIQAFNADSTPVFPINPHAQSFMQAVSPANAFNTGLGGGIGFGFNFKGQVEYAIDNRTAVGLAGSFNNSNSYDEGIVQLYLRKTFDWFAPVAFKNDPVSIVSRDQPQSRL